MKYGQVAVVVVLMFCCAADADILHTKKGDKHHCVIKNEWDHGYQVILLDGTTKYFRKDEVQKIDKSDDFAQMFFAVASSLDLKAKGGAGYFWLAYLTEENNSDAALMLYKMALQDDEIAPYAAFQLSRENIAQNMSMDPMETVNYLKLALAGCPWITGQDAKRLQVSLKAERNTVRSLNGDEILLYHDILNGLAANQSGKVSTKWDSFQKLEMTPTKQYLEKLTATYTGYTFDKISQELLYLVGETDKHKWDCPMCKGEGKVKCSKCNGAGWLPCSKCGGKGFLGTRIAGPSGTRVTTTRCSACGGKGYELCPVCKVYINKYGQQKRVPVGRGVRTLKVSGFKTCPTCKGTGRAPGAPEITDRISYVGLNTAEVREAFHNLAIQVWRLRSTDESWGATPVRLATPAHFARDIRSIPYYFYEGRWMDSDKIDAMSVAGKYTPPEPDEALLQKFQTRASGKAVPVISKATVLLSGRDRYRPELEDLANYYEIMANAGDSSSYEYRRLYRMTFKKTDAGKAVTDAYIPGGDTEFLLRSDDLDHLLITYRVEITEDSAEPFRKVLQDAEEVTIYARILSVSIDAEKTEKGLGTTHTIEVSPLAATVQRSDNRMVHWAKTESGKDKEQFSLEDQLDNP
ncbi:MAG: hypothetical protein JW909_02935 [Planctomycetes bacterium]|nr:hypothetical protein [Planctomycetota bacterium]